MRTSHGNNDGRLERVREWSDIRLGLGVEIGNGEVCARGAECACAAISDAVLVGDADNDTAFAGQIDDRRH